MDYRASDYLIPIFDFDVLHLQLNTPIYIFVLVLIVMFFLNRLLFQPVLKTLDARQAYLDKLQKSTSDQEEEIAKLTERYEVQLEVARKEVAQVRADARKEAQQAIDETLQQARQEADAELAKAMEELNREVEAARSGLGEAAQKLAEQATNRILNA